MFRSTLSSQAACGLALFLFGLTAQAGNFSVQPVRVQLSPGQPTASLLVKNGSDEETVVQVQANSWQQTDEGEVLEPTRDLLLTPPIAKIAPGKSQIIRIGLRRNILGRSELSYRLVLSEIPKPPEAGFTGLRMTLQISLPVFVQPTPGLVPNLEWSAQRAGPNQAWVALANSGAAHVQVKSLTVSGPEGEALGSHRIAEYVLPAQRRKWLLDLPVADAEVLHLEAKTDAGNFKATVPVGNPDGLVGTDRCASPLALATAARKTCD